VGFHSALAACACAVLLAGCGGDSSDDAAAPSPLPAWNHDPDDATRGPAAWGGLDGSFEQCRTGLEQSPIDIGETVASDLQPLELEYSAVPLVVENTGHTVEVPMPESSELTLTVGDDEYRLVQYHFHAPSEHTLDGESSTAEVHLVHESEEGQLAVVGVLLGESGVPSPVVDSAVENAPGEAGTEVEVGAQGSPLELVPSGGSVVADYVTYPGSLTTPGCSEGVRWIVLAEQLGISPAASDRLHELIAAFPGYEGFESNNRPTQPLNGRAVRRSTG
jgi:carbonic anhydrase